MHRVIFPLSAVLWAAFLALIITVPSIAVAEVVEYDLTIAEKDVNFTGRQVSAMTINGGIPGPTLQFKEGDTARIHVRNEMEVSTSIHWHGVLVPPGMDGVPNVSFPPIAPGSTFTYEFPIRHSGTYWYHSHSDLQEQRGVYGSLVFEPSRETRYSDKDYVVLFSDWTDENPHTVLRTLKRGSEWFALEKGSAQSIFGAVRAGKLGDYFGRELSRMPAMDIADVAYDRFLANGVPEMSLAANAGETVRLRFIDGSATTYFHLQFAGGPMTIIAADGQDVQPVEKDLFLIAVAETYDVLIKAPESGSWELRATAHDGSGFASVWIGRGERHPAPDLPRPNLYESMMSNTFGRVFALTPAGSMGMPDRYVKEGRFDSPGMNMEMGGMSEMGSMGAGEQGSMGDTSAMVMPETMAMDSTSQMPATATTRDTMGTMAGMGQDAPEATMAGMETMPAMDGTQNMGAMATPDTMSRGGTVAMPGMYSEGMLETEGAVKKAPMADMKAMTSLDQTMAMDLSMPPPGNMTPGGRMFGKSFGYMAADVSSSETVAVDGKDPRRPGTPYGDLKAVRVTSLDEEDPVREIRLTLDGDMERYVWFLNKKPLSETDSILIKRGESVRFIMINRTMMHHPMHLHGHFFRVINGQGDRSPLKHTVDVAPMTTTVIEFSANEVGDWFFHCHLLYHMKSGMARLVHYDGFDPGPGVNSVRSNLYKDSWYFWGNADLLSNMTEGALVASNTRNILMLDWEAGWEEVPHIVREGTFTWNYYLNRFSSVFAGANYEEASDVDETRGILGLRYLLPLNIESFAWVDDEGESRYGIEKEFMLTPRVGLFGELEYDTEERWEGNGGLSFMVSKGLSVLVQRHSEYEWGAGIQVRF
jgi:CopA family copper-resistance protein